MRKGLGATAAAALLAASWSGAHADVPDGSPDADTNARPLTAAPAASGSESVEQDPRLLVSARGLKGRPVRDADDVRVGTVRGIVLEQDGRASAVIVSAGGWLGLGRTRYRIVWEALDFRSTPDRIKVSAAAELQALPAGASRVARRKAQVRANDILLKKVVLENGARYGTVRDVIFRLNGRLDGLVIAPAPKLGDRRGNREPHVYRKQFAITGDGRIALPYARHCVPGSGGAAPARCNADE